LIPASASLLTLSLGLYLKKAKEAEDLLPLVLLLPSLLSRFIGTAEEDHPVSNRNQTKNASNMLTDTLFPIRKKKLR
jgi:hypothetical protein